MNQQCVLIAALLMASTMASPCETDNDCSGTYFCNCNLVCDICDELGMNCAAEAQSGRASECTDNPGMIDTKPGWGGPQSPETTYDDPMTTQWGGPQSTEEDEDAGCCYASDLSNRNADRCYDVDHDTCAMGGRMGCAWMEGENVDCSAPTAEPGCCYGSDNACDTDDEAVCAKNMKRKGCEWRSGADADCEPVPGCCSGMDAMCFGLDEALCAKNMKRKGCEWISGTTECVPPTAEPGCCYGSDSACDTDDETMCGKAKRKGCSWMSGADADCTIVTTAPEEGCCAGETERKTNGCGKSPSSSNCDNMNGCYWVDGYDADCAWADEDSNEDGAMCCGDSSSQMDMCSNSMSMNNCDGMNGCHWVTVASDCGSDWGTEKEMFFFAGHGVEEVMNSQVSLSTLLLCMVCLVALWKAYGWCTRNDDDVKVNQSAQADGQKYYQSV